MSTSSGFISIEKTTKEHLHVTPQGKKQAKQHRPYFSLQKEDGKNQTGLKGLRGEVWSAAEGRETQLLH